MVKFSLVGSEIPFGTSLAEYVRIPDLEILVAVSYHSEYLVKCGSVYLLSWFSKIQQKILNIILSITAKFADSAQIIFLLYLILKAKFTNSDSIFWEG